MRRFWILIVVLAMALAIAGPATGKKPEGKPNPNAAPIAVNVENGPWWVHEVDDVLVYTVYVENKTQSTTASVSVTVEFDPDVKTFTLKGGQTDFVEFSRTVGPLDLPSDGEEGEIVEPVTVSYKIDGVSGPDIVAHVSTVAQAYDPCPEDGEFTNVLVTRGACIWHPGSLGDNWKVTVRPPPEATYRMLAVTMRDHVPGNWCTPDGSGGGADIRWKPKDDPPDLLLDVFLPANGVCRGGGAGGATMPAGNINSFYLWLRYDALVTIEKL